MDHQKDKTPGHRVIIMMYFVCGTLIICTLIMAYIVNKHDINKRRVMEDIKKSLPEEIKTKLSGLKSSIDIQQTNLNVIINEIKDKKEELKGFTENLQLQFNEFKTKYDDNLNQIKKFNIDAFEFSSDIRAQLEQQATNLEALKQATDIEFTTQKELQQAQYQKIGETLVLTTKQFEYLNEEIAKLKNDFSHKLLDLTKDIYADTNQTSNKRLRSENQQNANTNNQQNSSSSL